MPAGRVERLHSSTYSIRPGAAPASRRARRTSPPRRSAPVGPRDTSVSPLSLEGTSMVPTSPFRVLRTLRRRQVRVSHPDAVSEARLNLPRRIDDPVTAAAIACDLLRHRKEDITLALYLDDRHRFVGHCVAAVGWVQAARLSARPILFEAQVCRSTSCILVRYHRWERLRSGAKLLSSHRWSGCPPRARPAGSPGGDPLRGVHLRVHASFLTRCCLGMVTPFPYHRAMSGWTFATACPCASCRR